MNNVIIVGASSGYGKAISKSLEDRGVPTVGLVRNNENTGESKNIQITDVSNVPLFSSEFDRVLKEHVDTDTVIFVTGDVVLKKQEDYTENDFKYTLDVNLGYIVEGVRLAREKGDVKNIVTFGSQWSYTENKKVLASYCVSKHLLKRFTQLLNEEGMNAYHYCVPTSKTEKALEISNFLSEKDQKLPLEMTEWAEPDEIAEIMIEHIQGSEEKEHILKFTKNSDGLWSLCPVDTVLDSIDEKMSGLRLDDFMNPVDLYKISNELYVDLTKNELLEDKEGHLEFGGKIV